MKLNFSWRFRTHHNTGSWMFSSWMVWLTLALILAGFLLRLLVAPFYFPFVVPSSPPYTFNTVFLAPYDAPQTPLPYRPGAWSDDIVYADAGWYYLHGLSPHEFNFEHPPVAKYLIGLSIWLTGNPNIFSLIFGVATLPGAYMVGATWFKRRSGGLLTAGLLSVDKLFIVFSAAVMLDIYTICFIVWSFWATLHLKHSPRYVYLLGVLLGLAVGTKWTATLYVLALLVWLALAYKPLFRLVLTRAVPLAILIYVGSYWMFFAQGNTPAEWLSLQFRMLTFQSELRYRPILASPYLAMMTLLIGIQWLPLMISSTQLGLPMEPTYNPALWPLFAIAAGALFIHDLRLRRCSRLVLPLAFFMVYVTLPNAYWYYALPVFPFGILSLVTWLLRLQGAWFRYLVPAYLGLVILMSLYYPYLIPL